ncbi:MAG TPA: S41 family peptidase [Candidatus Eisenbacteria bacterium]|nr:S41 family peptidase [Candidatus Eisenbacteria bacterium]
MTSRSRPLPAALAFAIATFAAVTAAHPARALEECRLMREPDIQGNTIVFAYAGDLWRVGRTGGVAERLTSHEGVEQFPKLSPDGRTVAFTAEYDGNVDAYTMPVEGGEPTRLTWHPSPDQVAAWYPDGKSILIRSSRASSIQRFTRFFRIPATGGFEQMLPLPTAGYASFSPDGRLLAFVSPAYDNRTWKRYKGGNAPDIWVYDFTKNVSQKITDWDGADEWPMWHGHTIYYCSDQGGRTANIWAYDFDKKERRQVTHFNNYDVKWPSAGSDAMVLENGGYLWVMDLPSEELHQIHVQVPDDKPATRPEYRNVANWIENVDLSPSGKRAVVCARGELFTVPAEKGDVRNLTQTPGVRERNPKWSPDGRWISFLSDAGGEYELHVIGADGESPDRQLTHGGGTFRYVPIWSPDSNKLLFSDKTRTLWWCDAASGKLTKIDHSDFGEILDYTWSGDSRWIAYTRPEPNNFGRIVLYSLDQARVIPVSDGMTDDFNPSFDPQGRWLWFVSRRAVDLPAFEFEYNYPYANTDRIEVASLRDTVMSPIQPESDEESGASDEGAGGAAGGAGKASKAKSEPRWVVQTDGLDQRVAQMPMPPGRYGSLHAFGDRILYVSLHDPDPSGQQKGDVHAWDFKKRKDHTVIADVQPDFACAGDGGKVLYQGDDNVFGIVETGEEGGHKVGDGKIATGTLMALVDPRQEWKQMFNEAWRLERDFYYDPAMGGLDWKAVGDRYRQLVPYVAHRADLNYILGELIGELSTSHAYVGGGDVPRAPQVDVGLLGADYTLDAASGRYRFGRIYRERDWNGDVEAPLGVPGVNVREGDYLLAVNGRPLRAPTNLYAAFTGTANHLTRISVGRSAADAHPRVYTVKPITNEASLRYVAWVSDNRAKVAAATHGKIAYIHVPNTAQGGIQEFTRQYYPQVDKEGIIVDERFNSGGFIPDFFIERLGRTTKSYWATRDGADFRTPPTAIDGPKCILANHYAGSGGDAFPYYFREAGLGPIIGTRTWGGLVGISHSLPLVDGGAVTMPDFGFWNLKGQWDVENHGVDPDIEVENTPDAMVDGHDPQLERAIAYCEEELQKHPYAKPARPKYKTQLP